MNFFINSPAYYTEKNGVINEIYELCSAISRQINVKNYTEALDTIGIVPIVAPNDILTSGQWKEVKRISLKYRFASLSLVCDYEAFEKGDIFTKKQLIVENILNSLIIVKKKLGENFDYEKIKNDISYVSRGQFSSPIRGRLPDQGTSIRGRFSD